MKPWALPFIFDSKRPLISFVVRHPATCVFTLALLTRVIVTVGIFVSFDGFLFSDDVTYHQMSTEVVTGTSRRWDAYTNYLFDTTATFLYPLTALYELIGPNVLAAQLFVALMGAGVAAVVTRLAMEWLEPQWALFAGVIIALLPSQMLWSSLILKDAQVWLLVSALGLAVVISIRLAGRSLLVAGGAAFLCLLGLAFLREHTMVMAAWAMVISAATPARDRLPRLAGALCIALVVPWVAGYGPLGLTLAMNPGSLQERRLANARGAHSAFVPVQPPDPSARAPSDSPANQPDDASGTDESGDVDGETGESFAHESPLAADVRHLPRGIAYLLLAPFPWAAGRNTGVDLARLEAIVWYPILGLALAGAITQIWDRRRRYMILFPLMAGTGSLLIYALTEGNVGTAYRHRGEFVWVVALLAALGWRRLMAGGLGTVESEPAPKSRLSQRSLAESGEPHPLRSRPREQFVQSPLHATRDRGGP